MWYDADEKSILVDAGDTGQTLLQLALQIERAIEYCRRNANIDIFEVRKFVIKHIKAMIPVDTELERAPSPDCRCEVLDATPIELDKLPLEQQCLLEVIQQESQKATSKNGIAASNDEDVDVKFTVTKQMIEAKMKDKAQRQN
jgi:hypothetical protein